LPTVSLEQSSASEAKVLPCEPKQTMERAPCSRAQPGKVERHSASFWREADMLASLNHPNVLRFYGVVIAGREDPAVIGIMTEFMRGGSLAQFLRSGIHFLPLRERAELALHAVNGLAYLHEMKIVHFDLKPDNLLLDAPLVPGAGLGVPAVKVADFGLSKHKWKNYVSGVRDLRCAAQPPIGPPGPSGAAQVPAVLEAATLGRGLCRDGASACFARSRKAPGNAVCQLEGEPTVDWGAPTKAAGAQRHAAVHGAGAGERPGPREREGGRVVAGHGALGDAVPGDALPGADAAADPGRAHGRQPRARGAPPLPARVGTRPRGRRCWPLFRAAECESEVRGASGGRRVCRPRSEGRARMIGCLCHRAVQRVHARNPDYRDALWSTVFVEHVASVVYSRRCLRGASRSGAA